jgi:hypothetical protein
MRAPDGACEGRLRLNRLGLNLKRIFNELRCQGRYVKVCVA